jgi:carbonic anhydrase
MTTPVSTELAARNADWAARAFPSGLRMVPSLKTIVIGCVDPRVDPADLLGTEPGEIAVIRNVGGRVTPDVLRQLVLLRAVSQSAGGDLAAGWELIVLQHTECGITRIQDDPGLPAFLGVDPAHLEGSALGNPRAAVAHDVAILQGMDGLGDGVRISGLVYDVNTGRVEPVATS